MIRKTIFVIQMVVVAVVAWYGVQFFCNIGDYVAADREAGITEIVPEPKWWSQFAEQKPASLLSRLFEGTIKFLIPGYKTQHPKRPGLPQDNIHETRGQGQQEGQQSEAGQE